jgi:hypothetical protein
MYMNKQQTGLFNGKRGLAYLLSLYLTIMSLPMESLAASVSGGDADSVWSDAASGSDAEGANSGNDGTGNTDSDADNADTDTSTSNGDAVGIPNAVNLAVEADPSSAVPPGGTVSFQYDTDTGLYTASHTGSSGITVKLTYTPGVFPEYAVLEAKEITAPAVLNKIDQAMALQAEDEDNPLTGGRENLRTVSFDIKILVPTLAATNEAALGAGANGSETEDVSGGDNAATDTPIIWEWIEVQPDTTVGNPQVTFTGAAIEEAIQDNQTTLEVFHVADSEEEIIHTQATELTPEVIPSEVSDESSGGEVTFETEHFSVLGVVLYDNNLIVWNGGSQAAQTLRNCLVVVNGTVTLTGTLTISGAVQFYGTGTIQRAETFTSGNMIDVSGGADLILNGITLDGNNVSVASKRGIYVSGDGSSVRMESGSIINHVNSTANSSLYGGSAVLLEADTGQATFTMNGGTISDNKAQSFGGAICIKGRGDSDYGGHFKMNGGTISGNTVTSTTAANGGAAIFVRGFFTMTGGTISGNTTGINGGAIYSTSYAKTNLEGGTISGNTSTYTTTGYDRDVFYSSMQSAGTGNLIMSGEANVGYMLISLANRELYANIASPLQNPITLSFDGTVGNGTIVAQGTNTYELTVADMQKITTGLTGGTTYYLNLDKTNNQIKLSTTNMNYSTYYPVDIYIEMDESSWSDHDKTLYLKTEDGTVIDSASSSTALVELMAPGGTYNLFDGNTDTGIDITVTSGRVSLDAEMGEVGDSDTSLPHLTAGSTARTTASQGTVTFTSNEVGTYAWGSARDSLTHTGNTLGVGSHTIDLSGLSGFGPHTIYIQGRDAAGNQSEILEVTIPAWITAPALGLISISPWLVGETVLLSAPSISLNNGTNLAAGWLTCATNSETPGDWQSYTPGTAAMSINGLWLCYYVRNEAGTTYSNALQISVSKRVTVTAPTTGLVYGQTLGDPSSVTRPLGTEDVTYTYSGTLSDGSNTTYASTTSKPTEPGTYTVQALVTDGAIQDSDTAAFTISRKPLTWTAGVAADKNYDQTNTASVTTEPSLNGVLSSDTVSVSEGTVTFTSSAANTNTLTASGWGITGADAWKYSVSVQPAFTGQIIRVTNNLSFVRGTSSEGDIPIGTDISVMTKGWDETVTIPANPYTLENWYFTGWKTTIGGVEQTYQPGDTFTMPNEDVGMTAVWQKYETKYETSAGVWAYGTFTQAIAGVMSGGSIYMQKNVTASGDITIDRSVTLMTDGIVSSAALNMGAYNLQVLDGTLTINDANLTITGSDSTYGTVIISSGSGSSAQILLQAGNVYNTGNTTGAKAAIYSDIAGSTISITGGTVQSTNGSGIYLSDGSLSVTGGTIQSTNSSGISISNGTLSVSGGTINSAADDGINVTGGTVTITGGTIDSDTDAGIYITDGDLFVTGGEIIGSTYAIYLNEANNSGNTLALAGAPKLTGATGDIYFANTYRPLEITAALTGEEIYSLIAATYDAGAPFSTAYATDYAAKFEAVDTYWHIGYSSDEESDNYQKLIWEKVVTITPNSAQSKIYTAANPIYTYKAYALGAEAAPSSIGITGALGRAAGENVAAYAYTLGTLAAPEGYYLVMSPSAPTFSIIKRGIAIPTIPAKTYNGSSQGYGMSDETAYTFQAVGTDTEAAANAGNYTISALLTDAVNNKWSDGTTAAKSVEWNILPKAITVVPADAARKVGEMNPGFTLQLVSGSTLAEADIQAYGTEALARAAGMPTFACLDDEDNPVNADNAAGTYDITITALTGSSTNYAVTYTGSSSTGTLTVTQDTITPRDYTFTPSGYTPGTWTNQTITITPADPYKMIRSIASDGTIGDWAASLTVLDASAGLTFQYKTTEGNAAGAISEPLTLLLQSDTVAPISTVPTMRVNEETGVMTVTLTIADDAAPGLLSGIDLSTVTLTQGTTDWTHLLDDSLNKGLTDGILNLSFIRSNTLDYTLTYRDNAGNQSTVTIPMNTAVHTLSFAPGESTEGDIPTGTTPANLSLWQYSRITLPNSPYTLPTHLFCGWEYKGKLYAPGDTFSMPGEDALFTAVWVSDVWSDATADIIFQNGKQVSNALVNLYLDGELIQQTESNGSGKFKFKNLQNRVYDIEIIIADQPVNQSQTFKVIVRDKKLISADNGAEMTELVIAQPEVVIEVSKQIRDFLPEWSGDDLKQSWESSDETVKAALETEMTTIAREVLDLASEYDALTPVQTTQFFDHDLEKWCQLLTIAGKITLTLKIDTQMAGVENPDALIGLLITAGDLEAHAASNDDIQIVFQIKEIPLSVDDEAVKKSLANLSLRSGANQREYKFFEITIRKIVGEEESIIAETPKDVELMFWIPENMQGGSDYMILRDHLGEISALPTRKIGSILYAWSSQFSNYAIAYTPTPAQGGYGGSGSGSEAADTLLPDPAVDVTSPKTREQLPVTANTWIAIPAAITGCGRRKISAPAPRRKTLTVTR